MTGTLFIVSLKTVPRYLGVVDAFEKGACAIVHEDGVIVSYRDPVELTLVSGVSLRWVGRFGERCSEVGVPAEFAWPVKVTSITMNIDFFRLKV